MSTECPKTRFPKTTLSQQRSQIDNQSHSFVADRMVAPTNSPKHRKCILIKIQPNLTVRPEECPQQLLQNQLYEAGQNNK